MATRKTVKKKPQPAKSAAKARGGTSAKRLPAKGAKGKSGAKPPKPAKPKKGARKVARLPERAKLLNSEVVFQGPLFRVQRDTIIEPTGLHSTRDVVRHNGSAVILAVDRSASKK